MRARMIHGKWGERKPELVLSDGAYNAFHHFWRAFDASGTACWDSLASLRNQAWGARTTPTTRILRRWVDEWKKAGLLEVYKDRGATYMFIKNWFRDNKLRQAVKTNIPRPPSLKEHVTEEEWHEGKYHKLYKIFEEVNSESINEKEEPINGGKDEVINDSKGETINDPTDIEGRSKKVEVRSKKKEDASLSSTQDNTTPQQILIAVFEELLGTTPAPEQVVQGTALINQYGIEKVDAAFCEYMRENVDGDWDTFYMLSTDLIKK